MNRAPVQYGTTFEPVRLLKKDKYSNINPRPERRWEDMTIYLLAKIFLSLEKLEFLFNASRVCTSWGLVCRNILDFRITDLATISSYYIKIPNPPYVYVAPSSDKKLTMFLKIALGLNQEDCNCLIFNVHLYLKDCHLIYVAERSPHLKQLVLPAWERLTEAGIHCAFLKWRELESLAMPCIPNHRNVFPLVGITCKNLTQLKIMDGPLCISFASSIATFLPKLKVLSLRCSLVYEEALEFLIDNMKHLEVLNLSHTFFVPVLPPPAGERTVKAYKESIYAKALLLSCLFSCCTVRTENCLLCQRMVNDRYLIRWYKYEEGLWCKDEVSSLSYGTIVSSPAAYTMMRA